ncbi:NUDIX hydrolase [Oceanicaulis sp. LC35]|uniref:NUDIX hydrolase n=1 Tax=Oceanicaulis sp. LC35 TaxID=3349635 RepID=UPI003F82A57D
MSEDVEAILARLRTVLDPVEGSIPDKPSRGDGDLNDMPTPSGRKLKPAAVLALLVKRESGLTVLFTRRADHLQAHAGQVSFPGGRQMAGRETLAECALRETEEEVGLTPDQITLLGRWETYETGTGYAVTPFAGVIEPGFDLSPDPGEVAEVFETPFGFLMDPDNHKLEEREFAGMLRRFYAMPHKGRYIWGATAGMLRALSIRYAQGRPMQSVRSVRESRS